MFKNAFQSGFLSVLYSIGSKPLEIWDKQGARMSVPPARRLVGGSEDAAVAPCGPLEWVVG